MDRRQNNGSVRDGDPSHCAATCALRDSCFNCRAGQSHKDNVRCTAVEEQPKAKEVQFASQLHLPAHDLFWANLRVQLQLPPLDLAPSTNCYYYRSQGVCDGHHNCLTKSRSPLGSLVPRWRCCNPLCSQKAGLPPPPQVLVAKAVWNLLALSAGLCNARR